MKTLLLIEDNNDIRENTAELLELAMYNVITAEDGKAGVEKAMETNPDLIVCDIMMPVLDGYGVLHALQKNDTLKNTPFIFLTAKTDRADFRKGMELGADDYITKPFDGTELLNAIDSRLKKVDAIRKDVATDISGNGISKGESIVGVDPIKSLTEFRSINKYKKKQLIYTEGNHPIQLYYVLKGKIKTFKSNDDGKELVTNLYSEGDFLGHIALLQGGLYKETAEAIDECELALVPKKEFEDLLHGNHDVAKRFISMLANNLVEKEQHLLCLAYNSLRKKVADALLVLKSKYHQNQQELFKIDISRENLATIAGTATESLIRTLSDFKGEKLIDIRDGHITIVNEKKLVGMIN